MICLQILNGCSMAMDSFAQNLNQAVLSNNDTQTVMQALPAYLILLDTMLEDEPENEDILLASSRLMASYAGLLNTQLHYRHEQTEFQNKLISAQIKKLYQKSFNRALQAICYYEEVYCDLDTIPYTEFSQRMNRINKDDIRMLYNLGTAWASWIQLNTDDWNIMAQLPRVKSIMQRVVEINENWDYAGAHMYLGVINSLIPAALGGKPDEGKKHFERAITLTDGKNLMVKVLYAEFYARLIYDEELHKRLLTEVVNSNVADKNMILINTIAREKARMLMNSAKEYF